MFRNYSKYLPNGLTLTRCVLADIYVSAAFGNFEEDLLFFFLIAIVAELTDLLDGKAARWLKIADPSGLGGIFDGFADMVWRSAVLSTLAYFSVIPIWLVLIFSMSDEFLLWVVRVLHVGH